MSRPARRPARIRPPHRGRTPSVSSAHRLTREVQPFVRPDPPRTGGRRMTSSPPPPPPPFPCRRFIQERLELVVAVLAFLMALIIVQINSNLIPH